MSRRKFLRTFALGLPVVYAANLPAGILLLAEAGQVDPLPGKDPGLTILNDRPVNAETPPHLLNDKLTPNNRFFVRNNGVPPSKVDLATWTLTIGGESVKTQKTYSLAELKAKFPVQTINITLECGGNGRSEFTPPAKGNQWSTGAVGCAAWTGVRLSDVLKDAGVKDDAVYIGYYGADTHLSGDPDKVPISRGVPITKAMEDDNLIAWAMNGEDIPMLNGYPLRLVIGGYPASCSGKWLTKIDIRNVVHDGSKMTGTSYRVPAMPVAPGAKVADEDMAIIEQMPAKSLITAPRSGATIKIGQRLPISGQAWDHGLGINKMEYSIDFGSTWKACTLSRSSGRYAWRQFAGEVDFPKAGYYEIWARATDGQGKAQPMLLPGWNPKGYLNNACHRIAVKVTNK
jgi:DMSO/TMAO reductase YedYZ molybdopterin-dependent catalytic subunit